MVASTAHDRAESIDSKGTYTTVVLDGEKDEVINAETFRKAVGQSVSNGSMPLTRGKLLLSRMC